jgi:hypothetical protein
MNSAFNNDFECCVLCQTAKRRAGGKLCSRPAFYMVQEFGVVVTTAERHRENAAACLQLAQNAPDGASRALYLMMAEAWPALAEKEDSRGADPKGK